MNALAAARTLAQEMRQAAARRRRRQCVTTVIRMIGLVVWEDCRGVEHTYIPRPDDGERYQITPAGELAAGGGGYRITAAGSAALDN